MTRTTKSLAERGAALRAKGNAMVADAIKISLGWLVNTDAPPTAQVLEAQLEGARDEHARWQTLVAQATDLLDAAADEDGITKAAERLETARGNAQRAADYVARAERQLARFRADQRAAERARLEATALEIEAACSPVALATAERPFDEREAELLRALIEVRAARVQLKRATCSKLGQLVRTLEALGSDSSTVERRIASELAMPTHSRFVLEHVDELATSFAPDDVRRGVATDLASTLIVRQVRFVPHQQAAE